MTTLANDRRVQKAIKWFQHVMVLTISVALTQQWGRIFLRQVESGLAGVGVQSPTDSVLTLTLLTFLAFQITDMQGLEIMEVIAGASIAF